MSLTTAFAPAAVVSRPRAPAASRRVVSIPSRLVSCSRRVGADVDGRLRDRLVARVARPGRRLAAVARASSGAIPPPGGADPLPPRRPASVLADLAASGDAPEVVTRRESSDDASRRLPRPAAVVLGASALFAAAALAPPAAKLIAPSPAVAGASVDVGAPLSNVRNAVAVYREYTPSEIFSYKIQKIFGLPLFGKIMCLFILTIPIVFIGGLAYKLVDAMDGTASDGDGDGEADGWTDKLRSAYYNLFDIPGADATVDESWRSFAVTQSIVVTGIFVVAVIIGIISDEIATKVEEVKTGNNRVIETDHTVVVNWNSQLVPLLRQMAVAKSERPGSFDKPVVLLADVDKEEMDEIVENALEDSPPLEVVTRRGNPFDAEDLAKVNAFKARRVVILHPHEKDVGVLGQGVDGGGGGGEPDAALLTLQKQQREEALKATVVLNLLADGSRDDVPDIVVQMPYRMEEKQDLVAHALALGRPGAPGAPRAKLRGNSFERASLGASSPYVQVHGSENTGKISAFSAFQPGTSRIFEELFKQSEETPEFYLSVAPQLAGKTFGEAWRMFPDATLCGLARADGTVELAPDDDALILVDDEVVMLSETSVVTISPADEASIPPRGSERYYMQCIDDVPMGRVRILFAGWNSETMVALNLAQSMAPAGSEITILSDSIPAREMAKLQSTRKCKLRLLRGVPTSYADLERAKVHEMDAVIVMPDHGQGKAEEDASVLATMLQTHAVCSDAAPGTGEPHVVATLNTESARSIVELMGKVGAGDTLPDVIMADDLVGGALLQVAANPRLAGLFDALLATEGHEMYLRDADLFGGMDTRGADGAPTTWGTVCERARERNELALGLMRADGEFRISPPKSEYFSFGDGDRIVVLAEDL